jgi:hypothetical protein
MTSCASARAAQGEQELVAASPGEPAPSGKLTLHPDAVAGTNSPVAPTRENGPASEEEEAPRRLPGNGELENKPTDSQGQALSGSTSRIGDAERHHRLGAGRR